MLKVDLWYFRAERHRKVYVLPVLWCYLCALGGGGVGQIGMVDRQNVLPVLWCAWLMLPLQQVCRSLQKQCTTARSHTF